MAASAQGAARRGGVEGSRDLLPALGLLLVSLIWGTTFVAVKSALNDASPLLFVGMRFLLGSVAASLLLLRPAEHPRLRRRAYLAGIPLGAILGASYAAQTIGLASTTPARSAFVTAISVVLVPFWAWMLFRRRPGWLPGLGLLLTIPGIFLLTRPEGGAWNRGDSWTAACSVLFALHVVLITRYGGALDAAGLLASQLVTTSVLALASSAVLEAPRLEVTPRLVGALALTAILATALTNWLQIRLQPLLSPARTAVIFAAEPVFAALFSFLWMGERLSGTALAGGALILAGMLTSELGSARPVPERS